MPQKSQKRKLKMVFKIFISLLFVVSCLWIVDYFSKGSYSIKTVEDNLTLAKTVEKASPLTKDIGKKNAAEKEKEDKKTEEKQEIAYENEVEVEKGYQRKNKIVYLTFDDGPTKWTGAFLDVLKEHGILATFFMQGNNLKKAPFESDVKRAFVEGNYIGAHSMTHDYTEIYKKRKFVSEMVETLKLIHSITGADPQLVRPPYGSIPGLNDEVIKKQVMKEGLKVWDWTIDSQDWKYQNDPEKILSIIETATTEDVEVILMHEKEQTLKLLPKIITFFKEQGYEFEVYSDLKHFPINFFSDNRI
ncbi:polysaccharide deacetylase family protein [Bacillus sp. JJ1562]|uniref:polysaccharide deacetylase family protein n=1 Tax=Bacillus sp. JJ1562 TaxID=3122960 RepID=UPI003F68ADCA